MKYVILIHSNPQPWGHPTIHFTELGKQIPADELATMEKDFDALLETLSASGELVTGMALGAPADSTIYRWDDGPVVLDGPYAEAKEYFAGYFMIDVATRERAEEIAIQFASPGDTIELRPEHVW